MKLEALETQLLLVALLSSMAAAQTSTRPNILLIIVDDLRPEIGAYGNEVAHTPNIDRLAASGFLFENAFAVVPVCGASRAAMLSGRKPTTHRFVSYDARLDQDLPDATSLPGYFKAHGYHTLANGKVFDVSADSAHVWSEPLWNPEGEWTSSVRRTTRHEDLQKAYLDNPDGVTGPPFERLDVDDADYPDGKLADKTVDDLKRLREADEPFFLAVGFRKPHLPFNAPDKYWKLYDPKDFELPSTYRATPDGAPFEAIHNSPELRNQYSGIPAEGLLEDSDALALIHAYHAAVSYADAQVGKVLDALEEHGLADDTIVVLVGDHGWNLGEHTMWTKHSLFDVTLRTPMILRDPNRKDGRVSTLDDPTRTIKPASFSRWIDGESVRTARFRYTEWRDEAGEMTASMLYDLTIDPEETRNVAEVSAYEGVVLELSARISANDSNAPGHARFRTRRF